MSEDDKTSSRGPRRAITFSSLAAAFDAPEGPSGREPLVNDEIEPEATAVVARSDAAEPDEAAVPATEQRPEPPPSDSRPRLAPAPPTRGLSFGSLMASLGDSPPNSGEPQNAGERVSEVVEPKADVGTTIPDTAEPASEPDPVEWTQSFRSSEVLAQRFEEAEEAEAADELAEEDDRVVSSIARVSPFGGDETPGSPGTFEVDGVDQDTTISSLQAAFGTRDDFVIDTRTPESEAAPEEEKAHPSIEDNSSDIEDVALDHGDQEEPADAAVVEPEAEEGEETPHQALEPSDEVPTDSSPEEPPEPVEPETSPSEPTSEAGTDDFDELRREAEAELRSFAEQDVELPAEDSTAANWEALTVAELKDELRVRGLKVSGRKSELIARIMDAEDVSNPDEAPVPALELRDELSEDHQALSGETVKQLKLRLRAHGLAVSGRKSELIDRLLAANAVASVPPIEPSPERTAFEAMRVSELKNLLRRSGLTVSGRKHELVDRLLDAEISPDALDDIVDVDEPEVGEKDRSRELVRRAADELREFADLLEAEEEAKRLTEDDEADREPSSGEAIDPFDDEENDIALEASASDGEVSDDSASSAEVDAPAVANDLEESEEDCERSESTGNAEEVSAEDAQESADDGNERRVDDVQEVVETAEEEHNDVSEVEDAKGEDAVEEVDEDAVEEVEEDAVEEVEEDAVAEVEEDAVEEVEEDAVEEVEEDAEAEVEEDVVESSDEEVSESRIKDAGDIGETADHDPIAEAAEEVTTQRSASAHNDNMTGAVEAETDASNDTPAESRDPRRTQLVGFVERLRSSLGERRARIDSAEPEPESDSPSKTAILGSGAAFEPLSQAPETEETNLEKQAPKPKSLKLPRPPKQKMQPKVEPPMQGGDVLMPRKVIVKKAPMPSHSIMLTGKMAKSLPSLDELEQYEMTVDLRKFSQPEQLQHTRAIEPQKPTPSASGSPKVIVDFGDDEPERSNLTTTDFIDSLNDIFGEDDFVRMFERRAKREGQIPATSNHGFDRDAEKTAVKTEMGLSEAELDKLVNSDATRSRSELKPRRTATKGPQPSPRRVSSTPKAMVLRPRKAATRRRVETMNELTALISSSSKRRTLGLLDQVSEPGKLMTRKVLSARPLLSNHPVPILSDFGYRREREDRAIASEDEILRLYRDFLIALNRCGNASGQVDFKSFSEKVHAQRERAKAKYGPLRLTMSVKITDGTPVISIKPK